MCLKTIHFNRILLHILSTIFPYTIYGEIIAYEYTHY